MKNFIIGYGETLTETVDIKSGGGFKNHPYSKDEGRTRFIKKFSRVIKDIEEKPSYECVNDEVVIKFIQHPSYLAKSYYPKALFRKFNLHDVGSKSTKIKPEKWAVKVHPEEGTAACIYVSGSKKSFSRMLDSITFEVLDKNTLDALRTIEDIQSFKEQEKVKWISNDNNESLKLEVVIHATENDYFIIDRFREYISYFNGEMEEDKIKYAGGLAFLPVMVKRGNEIDIAKFSHLRALRSMPKLRINKPNFLREIITSNVSLPPHEPLKHHFNVCIFDGGIGSEHLLTPWITEIVPDDVKSTSPDYLSHGGEVCSTYLFGPYNGSLAAPYTYVDIVRVLSPDDSDPDLFDVLTRIENVLKEKKYKYINLSLGPQIPIEDDDVHVWTSVLDKYLHDGNCLATVAVGNDGDLTGNYARLQPPSDMVNSLAVGACNSNDSQWKRSHYSCIGPGRSPGIVKPDGVSFGGDVDNRFPVYSPKTGSVVGTMGTSFSAPLALRTAAGIDAITDFDLKATTVKALMIHKADNQGQDMKEVGWGRFPLTPEEAIECLDDEAIIIYQGTLSPSQHLRIPVPLPNNIQCTWVHLKATFCINAPTDPEHPLNYTQSGLEVTFRPNFEKYTPKKGKISEHPDSSTFFSCGELYQDESELREDAHKWETSISRKRRFKLSTLNEPFFDVKFHERNQSGPVSKKSKPISYSLIISIRTEGDTHVYNSILQQYRTLQSVRVVNRVRL